VERFGRRLRRLRLARGLSCSQLAYRVGVTEGAIRQMESGQTKIASFVVGLRLAKELGTTPWYLAHGPSSAEHDSRDRANSEPGTNDPLVDRIAALERRISLLIDDRVDETKRES
jgi:transcriptional regulator with XRE-family HTH domain